jgi:hypothetical protein
MQASTLELQCSRMHMLLDELETGKHIDPKSRGWAGYDSRAYGKRPAREQADTLARTLCEKLTGTDVSQRSLELQMWWRDHQRADAERKAKGAITKKENPVWE